MQKCKSEYIPFFSNNFLFYKISTKINSQKSGYQTKQLIVMHNNWKCNILGKTSETLTERPPLQYLKNYKN